MSVTQCLKLARGMHCWQASPSAALRPAMQTVVGPLLKLHQNSRAVSSGCLVGQQIHAPKLSPT